MHDGAMHGPCVLPVWRLQPIGWRQGSPCYGVCPLSTCAAPRTCAPATEVGCAGTPALTNSHQQHQVHTVVELLKVNEKDASTDAQNVRCLHHETGVDGR